MLKEHKKFIKSKYGVYRYMWTDDENSIGCERGTGTGTFMEQVFTHDIVAESDNLIDLCDEFVVCYNGKTICQFARCVWNYDEIKHLGNGNDFYGAIWTDKGLIYVARLNEQGELELI